MKDKLNFPEAVIEFILKRQTNKNKAVRKAGVKFTFPRQIRMFYLTPFQIRGFSLRRVVLLSNKTFYNTAILKMKDEQTRSE